METTYSAMTLSVRKVIEFIEESNLIEGIDRHARKDEISEFMRFYELPEVRLSDLVQFVSIYEPTAKLRDKAGLNVRVGNHIPPPGGPMVIADLQELLADQSLDAFEMHLRYERLHPFTDCNGRSGRMLWAWKHRQLDFGFLRAFYYQSLAYS